MVQILPAAPTFGGEFGKGLGTGIAQSLPEKLDQFFTRKREEKERSKIQQMFQELGPDASAQDKMGILFQSNLPAESQKQGLELLRQEGAQSFADRLREGGELSQADLIEGVSLGYISPGMGQELVRQIDKPVTSDEGLKNLANWAGYTPNEVKGFTPEQLINFGKINRKRIDAYSDKTENTYQKAVSADQTLEILSQAIQEGGADPLTAANFADYFEAIGFEGGKKVANALENPSSTRFRSAVKELFSDLTTLFGARPNQYIEKLFFSFLPQIGKSKEANQAAIEVLQIFTDSLKRPFEISEEIFNEKGFLPHDISRQVTKKLSAKKNEYKDLQEVLENFHSKYGTAEIVQKKEEVSPEKEFDIKTMPKASEHPGKIIEDEKGKRYKSTGKTWRRV